MMPRICPKCGKDNRDDSDMCMGCSEWLVGLPGENGEFRMGPGAVITQAADILTAPHIVDEDDVQQVADPNALARYREAVESYCVDGVLDDHERELLGHQRRQFSIPQREAEQIEQQVQHQFRKRVQALVHRDTLSANPVNEWFSPRFAIINDDRYEYYQEANCQLVIRRLGYKEEITLPGFSLGSRRIPDFKEFRTPEAGTLDAELRVILKPCEGKPIVLRSRSKELRFKVESLTPSAPHQVVHQHFQAGGDMRVIDAGVRDQRIDAGIHGGAGFAAMGGADSAAEWQEITLEYDRATMEDLAEEDKGPVHVDIIERPASYRSGAFLVDGPGGNRRLSILAAAVARIGRNRTHDPDDICPKEKLNDIRLDLRSETLPDARGVMPLSDTAKKDRYEKYRRSVQDAYKRPRHEWEEAKVGLDQRWQRLGLSQVEAEAIEREEKGRTFREAIDILKITGHAHLTLRCLGQKMILKDDSAYGTVVDGTTKLVRTQEAELDDRTSVKVAGVMDLMLEVFRSSAVTGAVPLNFDLLRQLSDETINTKLVGFDKAGDIDAVRIRRMNYMGKEREHLVLIREARIGTSAYDVIQLRDPAIGERHARLLVDRYQGQFWIECLADKDRIMVNDKEYRNGQRVGLVFGDLIQIGNTSMKFLEDSK